MRAVLIGGALGLSAALLWIVGGWLGFVVVAVIVIAGDLSGAVRE